MNETGKTRMADERTKKTLAQIPLLKTKASPRDDDLWRQRLKEEYQALIEVNFYKSNAFFFTICFTHRGNIMLYRRIF